MKKPNDMSPLMTAALAFDEELDRFARATEAAARPTLDSPRSMQKVASALDEAVASESQLGPRAQALLEAILVSRKQQEEQALQVRLRADELKQRWEELNALVARFQQISADASALNEPAQKLATAARTENVVVDLVAVREGLTELEARLADSASSAQTLSTDARGSSFEDLGREAMSLHQTLLAMRNKLGLLRKSLKDPATVVS